MKKTTEILLVSVFLLIAMVLRYAFWTPLYIGTDFFYHATIVKQSLEEGKLQAYDNLVACGKGGPALHPVGLYILPYAFSLVFGIYITFLILPVLLGVLSLFLFYLVVRK